MQELIFYGAGRRGEKDFRIMKELGLNDYIFGWCDRNADEISQKEGLPVLNFEEAIKKNLTFIITVSQQSSIYKEIQTSLEESKAFYYRTLEDYLLHEHGIDRVEYNRLSVAANYYAHSYYESAEKDLAKFWGEKSPFLPMFAQLDIADVIELACGHGRHVPQYEKKAKTITLVDVNSSNIDYCKKRFRNNKKVLYYLNNGTDLSELEKERYSAIFSYDSMVQFELIDIYKYLEESYRVLKYGGRALFHHSNMDDNYKQGYANSTNPGGRSFMSKKIFAYLAYRVGFNILEQKVIDWSLPKMDCITLLEKI